VPVPVSGLTSGMVAVAAGEMHACALTAGGGVKCWGKNDYGQLGNGTDDAHSLTPVDVQGLTSGVTAIASGRYHSCAVLTSGAVKCWGGNLYGEQGIGEYGNGAHVPADVMGLSSGVVGVSGGDSTTCARLATGAIKCWGRGSDGELGDGESGFNVDKYLPTDVVSISAGTTVVSNGYGYTCAVVAGGAKCWGSNLNYVIGNGQDASFLSAVPVDVQGLTSGVVDIAASSTEHTCAVTAAGAVFCWGAASANLGNGDTSNNALAPVAVLGLP
jgi:alpha-tubulin suppressor-like RCC1 family protein